MSHDNHEINLMVHQKEDDPDAGLAARLLLALGIWPEQVNTLGEERVIFTVRGVLRNTIYKVDREGCDCDDMAGSWWCDIHGHCHT